MRITSRKRESMQPIVIRSDSSVRIATLEEFSLPEINFFLFSNFFALMDVREARHVSDLIHDPFCFCAAGRELTWPTSAFFFFFFSLSFSISAVEHSVEPITFFLFSFIKAESLSLSHSLSITNTFIPIESVRCQHQIRPNRWDVVTYKNIISDAQMLHKKASKKKKILLWQLNWKQEPPDCDRDSNSWANLGQPPNSDGQLGTSRENKPRPLYESNNRNNFSLERRRRRGCQ